MSAEEAFAAFEQSTVPGAWQYIEKSQLIADMRQKVSNPYSVLQGSSPLCGPASIVFELVSRQPAHYVEICQSLFESGMFRTRTMDVRPRATLLESRVRSGISLADWMLMAALRDAENLIFPVETNSGPLALGITTPWEMKGWTSEVLGYSSACHGN